MKKIRNRHWSQRYAWLGTALLLGLSLAALTGCHRGGSGEAGDSDEDAAAGPVTVEFATATLHPMETTIAAQGTLAPGQGEIVHVAPAVAGRIVAVNVKEGQAVTAGQVVALVDNRPQQAAVSSANAAVSVSDAQAREAMLAAQAAETDQKNAVHLAKLTLEAAQADRDGAIKTAQNALQSAQTDLQKTKAGARPQEIAQADQAVNQAKATRDRAATELDRNKKLIAIGMVPQRQLDDAQTAYDVAESAWESAKQQDSLIHAGARSEDLQAAQLRVEGAQEQLRQARIDGDAKVAQAQAALQQAEQSALQVQAKQQDARAQSEVARQKRADLMAAQATANYAEVRAPIRGNVTRRMLNPGDMADTTNPILEIANTHGLNLLANLAAEDGMKVRAGMPVHVTSQDAPGRTFSGSVLSVGQVDPQTNLLAVRILVANAAGVLRVGSFAQASIVLHSDPKAVVVPKAAVLTKDGKDVIFTAGEDNIAHQQEVTVGPEANGLIAITEGVKAGERVIVVGQYELADKGKVQEAGKDKDDAKKDDAKSDKEDDKK